MKTMKTFGYASLASLAFAVATPTLSFAETTEAQPTSAEANSTVHRVSHALATKQVYTSTGASGYKWGSKDSATNAKDVWATQPNTASGYRWGAGEKSPASSEKAGRIEQTGKRWGRGSTADQTGKRWGRG